MDTFYDILNKPEYCVKVLGNNSLLFKTHFYFWDWNITTSPPQSVYLLFPTLLKIGGFLFSLMIIVCLYEFTYIPKYDTIFHIILLMCIFSGQIFGTEQVVGVLILQKDHLSCSQLSSVDCGFLSRGFVGNFFCSTIFQQH